MVNVFGQSSNKGPPGERGEKGDGLPTLFFTKTITDSFEKEMTLSYYFDTEKSGLLIEHDKAVGLKNQVDKTRNALGTVGKMIKYPGCGKYSLKFTNEIYEVKGKTSLSLAEGMKSIIILNFKVDEPNKGYIFSTNMRTRQLYIDGHNIVLDCRKGKISLPYNIHRWNLVYIELNNPLEGEMDSIFRVNEKNGVLRILSHESKDDTLYIGGMDGLYFQGQIGRFDTFEHICDENDIYENLSENIRNIYISYKYETLF